MLRFALCRTDNLCAFTCLSNYKSHRKVSGKMLEWGIKYFCLQGRDITIALETFLIYKPGKIHKFPCCMSLSHSGEATVLRPVYAYDLGIFCMLTFFDIQSGEKK